MKYFVIAITAIVLLGIGGFVVANSKSDTEPKSNNGTQNMSLVEKVEAGKAQLVDVRTPQEHNTSYAKDSINIPLDEIQKGNLSKFARDKPIYLYCRSGNRSGQAKTILEKAGYKDITNVGGLDDWKSQGGTVIIY